MKTKFYGTRGSIPVCEKGFQEFGGNTTCVAVYGDDSEDILIFDAGTGIRSLGNELMNKELSSKKKIVMIFSHFHWDHIQGFPFFAPAYDLTKNIQIVAIDKDQNVSKLRDVFDRQMEKTYFPVQLDNMGANFSFEVFMQNELTFPNGKLVVNEHTHPGGAHGYRLEIGNKILVYCTDVEHSADIDLGVVELSRNADILIHDAQYTPQELIDHKGWGHSSWEEAIKVATKANVKKLYLTHHDPSHNDEFLNRVELECQMQFKNCFLAREGDEIVIE